MASEWGNNTIGSRQTAGWFFVRPTAPGFLPVISVRPLSPSFTDGNFSISVGLQSISFPFQPQLGVSTIWSKLANDGSVTVYFLLVMNWSNSAIQYSFVEADI
jgi:hypothetical protein